MRKLMRKLHSYLSVPFGIVIFILCLSGSLLTFQQEILQLSNPSHYNLNPQEVENMQPLPLSELISEVNSQLKDNTVKDVTLYDNPLKTYRMSLAEGFRLSVFVNPYTGKIVGEYSFRDSFFFKIMSLHRWLLDDTHTWGKYTVAWSTVAFIAILITGLFYIRKRSKQNYVLHLNKGKKRFLFDAHNSLGHYAILILLICSFTGLMWSFDSYRNAVFYLFGDRQTQRLAEGRHGSRGNKGDKPKPNYAVWEVALKQFEKHKNNYDYLRIENGSIAAHPNNTYRTRVTDDYKFNPETGDLGTINTFSNKDVKTKVWAWAYSLHVGDYWGIWSKILTSLACLIGASLPLTGYYSWYRKRRKKR